MVQDRPDRHGPITNQVLGPVTGSVLQVGHVDSITYSAGAPARSRYLEWVRQVAPQQLVGREEELAELARFCTAPDPAPGYVWWRAAPWAGKSALMATFVLAPPDSVRMVSFFVTARSLGDDRREAFVDVVQEQLAEILGTAKDRDARNLNAVFAEAAEHCRERGERLVLLVDGLDEDQGASAGGHSIAALLPLPAHGLRVIVSSRFNPGVPSDVREDHPVRAPGIERSLAPSPAAVTARGDMEREVDALLRGSAGEKDLLGFLVAARGGLTSSDLAELTQRREREAERVLNSVASRSFTRRPAHWRAGEAPEIFLLAHETLQREAAEALGPDELARYLEALDRWAGGYRDAGWPVDTPQFLLRGYFRLVRERGDVAALADLAGDQARQERLLDVSGGEVAAMEDLEAARAALLDSAEPDLIRLITVETYRDNFRQRNKNTPAALPAVWAALGRADHAVALAQSMIEPAPRRRALLELTGTLVRRGEIDRARRLAEDEHEPDLRDALLAEIPFSLLREGRLAEAAGQRDERLSLSRRKRIDAFLVAAGPEPEVDRALLLAKAIPEEELRTATLRMVGALLVAGHPDLALRVADALDGSHRVSLVFDVARRLRRDGETARAQDLMQEAGDSERLFRASLTEELTVAAEPLEVVQRLSSELGEDVRDRVLFPAVMDALTASGRLEAIPAVLDSMTGTYQQDEATIRFITALVADGQTERAFAYAEKFEPGRPPRLFLFGVLRLWTALAEALLKHGDQAGAYRAAQRAERLARGPLGDHRAVEAITALAGTVVAAGDIRRAELLAPLVPLDEGGRGTIRELAELLAAEGDFRVAEKLIRGLELLPSKAPPMVVLARRLRNAGDRAALAGLAGYVRSLAEHQESDREFERRSARRAVMTMLCAVGEPAEIIELAARYRTDEEDLGFEDTIAEGLNELAARGEAAVALEMIGLLSRYAERVRRDLVSGLLEAGHLEQAEAVVGVGGNADERRDRLLEVFLPELARHDPARAVDEARGIEFAPERARVLVKIAANLAPDERKRVLAEAVRIDHWAAIVPALDTGELAGLLNVADRLGALRHQDE
ncbi:hypothetical protein [Amycolatopsis sp. NBC_01480]|uniref:hypothetical protein n=1 Tax=Amycolatopsis sp. NBC_01480 TaxID=2903562 RepID=UPI002E28CD81|nr:hypothetical protein [Amycolatopsis sp. NBC_01480]